MLYRLFSLPTPSAQEAGKLEITFQQADAPEAQPKKADGAAIVRSVTMQEFRYGVNFGENTRNVRAGRERPNEQAV